MDMYYFLWHLRKTHFYAVYCIKIEEIPTNKGAHSYKLRQSKIRYFLLGVYSRHNPIGFQWITQNPSRTFRPDLQETKKMHLTVKIGIRHQPLSMYHMHIITIFVLLFSFLCLKLTSIWFTPNPRTGFGTPLNTPPHISHLLEPL